MSVDELVTRAQQQLAPLVQQEAARQSRQEKDVAEELVDGVLAAVGRDWAGSGQQFLNSREELAVRNAVLAEMFGLDQLLADGRIENIDIIGNEPAWLSHHDGRVTRGPRIAATDAEVVQWLQRTAARMGRTEHTINDARPLLNMELPGGERLAAAIGVTDRPHISIRRHRLPTAGLEELRRRGMISAAQLILLRAAVRVRALCWEIPPTERFATLETEFVPSVLGFARLPGCWPTGC
ncbi:MAG: hypothetical protein QOI78_9157 [Actinomycetota bacterium]|nr:hypothetical protein [Actinomycetota bacterium]